MWIKRESPNHHSPLNKEKGQPKKKDKKKKPHKEWVKKQTTNLGENEKETQQSGCIRQNPPLPPKDISNKRYNLFDVILKKGDLVKYWNNVMPEKYYQLEMLWHGSF